MVSKVRGGHLKENVSASLAEVMSDELVTCGVVAEGEFKTWRPSLWVGWDREDGEGQ